MLLDNKKENFPALVFSKKGKKSFSFFGFKEEMVIRKIIAKIVKVSYNQSSDWEGKLKSAEIDLSLAKSNC